MAELSLAVVPLIISAGEHFSSATEALSRYKHFAEEVEDYFAELNVQCTIFRCAVQLLLASFVGDEQAAQMLLNGQHDRWKDSGLESYLLDRFSTCSTALEDSLTLLRNRLVSIQKLSNSLQDVVAAVDKNNPLPLKKRLRRIGKKINIACSKHRINQLIESLKTRTQDFRILIDQSERLVEQRCSGNASLLAKRKVSEFADVKAAADSLYSTFGQACTKHAEHQAYIGLQPTQSQYAQVNFILAFRQMTLQPSVDPRISEQPDNVVWMNIESSTRGNLQTEQPNQKRNILAAVSSTLKRSRASSPVRSLKKVDESAVDVMERKVVRFQEAPIASGSFSQTSYLPEQSPVSDSLQNLCSHSNFCNKIQKIIRQPDLLKGRCIGYLAHCDSSKHMVYIDSRKDITKPSPQSSGMTALSQLFKGDHRSTLPARTLFQDRKFRLGIQLATAVLQFYDTSWLKESWTSDDIIVSEVKSPSAFPHRNEAASHESFADVSIRGQDTRATLPKGHGWSYIRNRPLFNLGKILLELAFEAPFHDLKRNDTTESDRGVDQEYFAARELQRQVSAKLGIKYSEVVRKCIECDFGQGDDLTQENLQASFYQHVICELETCERQALGRM